MGAWSGYRLKVPGGHNGAVVWATQNRFDGVAAIAVQHLNWRSVGVSLPSVSPLHEGDHGGDQVDSFVGEPVFVPFALSGLAIGHPVSGLERSFVSSGVH